MRAAHASPWGPRLVTLTLWALAAASATFWLLKWSAQAGPTREATAHGATIEPKGLEPAVNELLGASGAINPSDSITGQSNPSPALQLAGVIRVGEKGQGSALLQPQGKPAKPYRVGDQVTEGLVLQAVTGRSAQLGAKLGGSPSLTLELPKAPASP